MRRQIFIVFAIIFCSLIFQGCAAIIAERCSRANNIGTETDVKIAIEKTVKEEVIITELEWNIISFTKAKYKKMRSGITNEKCVDTDLFHPPKIVDCNSNQ